MIKEKILEYLYEINAQCDYKLEEVAEDILNIIEAEFYIEQNVLNKE